MKVDLGRKKILLVDDFADMRSTLKRMLQSFDAKEIDVAANGKDAIASMARKSYDIILCDYNLGDGKDGQQVLEEAKHKGLIGAASIFIMITAENTMEMVMGAVEYRPDDYLTKPFNKDLLGGRLQKLIVKKSDLADIERATQRKEFNHAIALCDQRIAAKPKNLAELLRIKGDLCMSAGNYDEAARVFEKVLALRSIPWAMLGLGKVRFLTGNFLEARDIFQQITQEHRTYVEAYDWLAKTMEELGDLAEAQIVLTTAVEMSPKAILRQKALGEVAMKNDDFELAERAFRKTVRLGRESVYRSPTDYTKLARSLSRTNSSQEALKVLHSVRKEFDGDKEAALHAAMAEGAVFKTMGRESEAYRAFEEATKLYEGVGGKVDSEVTMEMAKAAFTVGESEKGMALMQEVVRNHHEDEKVLREAQAAFEAVGMGEEGRQVISDTKAEVVQLNNQGVRLVKEGKLEEAIHFFEDAVKAMSDNKTVNLNAAQVMLMAMQKSGKNDRYLYQVRQYLDRVRKVDPANGTFQKLSQIYEKMITDESVA
ncbi:tetratricopeptide repeat protein [Endothiovibrio diazotrophicus]